ncbi:MAG: hypothetical protein K6U09_12805 [Acidobacteriia bacterium]|nr:hypothetical protein [Terriglobia bacterium]
MGGLRMIVEMADVLRYNAVAQARRLEVRGVDKRALAALLRVSVRTVQRWFAPPGGQYRPLVAPSWAEREWRTLTPSQRLRVVLGALLADEETRFCGFGLDLRQVGYDLRTLADCLEAVDALADGAGAAWLVCNWRRARVARAGEAWRLTIVYEAERDAKRRGVEGAYGVFETPPPDRGREREAWECEPSQDCPGDDWRRDCCYLERRAQCCARARGVVGV